MNTSTLDAIDRLLQLDAVGYAGMSVSSLRALQDKAIPQVSLVGAALVRLENRKDYLIALDPALDTEQE